MTEQRYTVAVPGLADARLADGDYPVEHPEVWARYRRGPIRRYGSRGRARIATLSAADWRDLIDYLDGLAEVTEVMLRQGDGPDPDLRAELRALRLTLERIAAEVPGVRATSV